MALFRSSYDSCWEPDVVSDVGNAYDDLNGDYDVCDVHEVDEHWRYLAFGVRMVKIQKTSRSNRYILSPLRKGKQRIGSAARTALISAGI